MLCCVVLCCVVLCCVVLCCVVLETSIATGYDMTKVQDLVESVSHKTLSLLIQQNQTITCTSAMF